MEFHTKPSTWAAVGCFCASAFTSNPSVASLLVHILLVGGLWAIIWLAHIEGAKK